MLRSRVIALPCCVPLLLGGCLMPSDIEEEAELPNYPPVFAAETVTPPFEQEVHYDPQVSTEPITFVIPDVTDVDTDDRAYWRWFVNYDARFLPGIAAAGPSLGGTPVDGRTRISYSLSPCEDLAAFAQRSLHRVEVVVADRPFLENDEATVARNQRLSPDTGQFRVVWFVEVDLTACAVAP